MDQITGYIFPIVWGFLGVYLVYMGKKVNRFCYYLSILFFFMCGWYLANHLMPDIDLFKGTPGIIFRVFVAIFLIVGVIIYFFKVKKGVHQRDQED